MTDHTVIAQFLDGAGRERRQDRLFDTADLFAFVAGDARLRLDRHRTGKAMVAAVRALPDRAEDK